MEKTMIDEQLRAQRLSEYKILLEVVLPGQKDTERSGKDDTGPKQSPVM